MAGGRNRDAAKQHCGCLHRCLGCIDRGWFQLRAKCKRRRNSYKLYLYHWLATVCSVLTFLVALILYLVVWGGVKGLAENCTTNPVLGSDAAIKNQTLLNTQAVRCVGEEAGAAACELPDVQAMLNFILVNGVTNAIQLLFSMMLASAFRRFTDLPQENLQYGKTSRTISCLGIVCKKGPWVTRLMHFFQMFALWVLWGMIMDNKCRGDLTITASCETYAGDCAYNQVKNCQYYNIYCFPDLTDAEREAAELLCFTAEGRAAFSGRMDIRLLTTDSCVRCQVLAADALNPVDQDEYYLLDEADKGTEKWKCTTESCFHTAAWANVACKCGDTFSVFVDLNNADVATWWTGLKGTCAARRLGHDDDDDDDDDDLVATSPTLATAAAPAVGGAVAAQWRPLAPRRLAPDEQGCSWAPDNPSYFYADTRCEQGGSFIYRFSSIYIYLAGCLCVLLTLVGQAVRVSSRPEPWFANPNQGSENIIFKCWRLCGP